MLPINASQRKGLNFFFLNTKFFFTFRHKIYIFRKAHFFFGLFDHELKLKIKGSLTSARDKDRER